MEEKAFSTEQDEDVIDLYEIVDSSAESPEEEPFKEDPGEEVIDLMPEHIEAQTSAADEPQEGLSLAVEADCVEPDGSAEGGTDDAVASKLGTAEAASPLDETSAPQEVLALSPEAEAVPDDMIDHLEQRIGAFEADYLEELTRLEDRLAESEKMCAELSAKVEELQQQLADCSTIFLEDASVRLSLEEMVSRMLDARLPQPLECDEESVEASCPEGLPAEPDECEGSIPEEPESVTGSDADPESDPASSSVAEGVAEAAECIAPDDPAEDAEASENVIPKQELFDERIVRLEERVGALEALEARVMEWESRCEQEAALAAARIIREEIAAMRAASARSGL